LAEFIGCVGTDLVQLLRSYDWAIANPLRGVDSFGHGINIMENMNLVAWNKKR
jgi:hypothetical protein